MHENSTVLVSDLAVKPVGLAVINRETGEQETFIPFEMGETEMPGYVETVEKGYHGTKWYTERRFE